MPDARLVRAAARATKERYGIDVPDYQLPLLGSALERLGGGSQASLDRLLSGEQDAWHVVIEALTVPETYFFRHPGHYALLRELAERRLAARRPLRVLSAGCSSGEEAWSAAAVLVAACAGAREGDHVDGWDASEHRLRRAREGRYRAWSVRDGFGEYASLFAERDGAWEVAPILRSLVRFERVNLAAPPAAGPVYGAIFYRNVSIYWDAETTGRVLTALGEMLEEDGMLLVGPSDPGTLDADRWAHSIEGGVRCFRRRAVPLRGPEHEGHAPPSAAAPIIAPAVRAPVPVPVPARLADPLEEVRCLAGRGEYATALGLLARAPLGSADAKLWEGVLRLQLDDAARAVELLRASVFLEPERVELRRWLAVAYRAAGRAAEAAREERNAEELA